ncbi:MAG: sigma-70 family RNA polymerase sigma factor [Clostridia bacterium]|nr:sigma-70 family RNA polymerase sigma factor [Clostridia bacterium]MBR1653629.1 sigma-70 family RNA polymerase sigma factor [Clostridia bacterium]
MKKLTTQITKGNQTKIIYAIVDDKTAKLLEKADEKVRHEYIVGEHEIYLNELKETRRHQSLDISLENGHEFEDEDFSLEDALVKKDEYSNLHKAISSLSQEQQWLVKEVYFKGRPQVDVANELGICKSAISHKLERIFNKIKNFLK